MSLAPIRTANSNSQSRLQSETSRHFHQGLPGFRSEFCFEFRSKNNNHQEELRLKSTGNVQLDNSLLPIGKQKGLDEFVFGTF